MRIAMLSPVAWRTPPEHYGPWELVVSLITEGLVERGIDVTLFATLNSQTVAKLEGVWPCGYEEDRSVDPKVWECLHISHLFEQGDRFDLIHNNFDFLPLTYSHMTTTPLVSTIHGFSAPDIVPVYKKYNKRGYYVSISDADRHPDLDYTATVYHGIDLSLFDCQEKQGNYLLFFGRIHRDKGAKEAIEIARQFGMKLIMAGIIQDEQYHKTHVKPCLDGTAVEYVGAAGPELRNELMGGAYALLHPINFAEPFGLSVVESMACGTPVIAFAKGSMPEVIDGGRTGFLVANVEEAVAKLADIPRIKRSDCRGWVEAKFTVDRMVDEYVGVYKEILTK